MRSRLLPVAVLLLLLPAAGRAAGAGPLDLAALREIVEAGAASPGGGAEAKAYARLSRSLAKANGSLPGDIGRIRPVASACAGVLAEDAPLGAALDDALDAAVLALRAEDAGVLGVAGSLLLESRRDSILRRAAQARNLLAAGETKRFLGLRADAAGLFRKSALRFAAAGRSAERLLAKQTPRKPVWGVPVQGRGGALLGVWGESGVDPRIYVVGAADAEGPQFLVRSPGAEGWVRVPVAEEGDLWWVTVVPGDAAWASGSGGRVLRYDPEAGEVELLDTGVEAILYGVWGTGPDDVWTVGGDPEGTGPRPALLHWDGAGWTAAEVPAEAAGRMLYKVWGSASDDVWAVGEGGLVLHYDGDSWTPVPSATSTTLLTVSGPSPVTAVGGGVAAVAVERGEDGTFAPVPVRGVASGSGGQTGGGAVRTLNGVFVPSVGPAMAVGFSGTLVRRNASAWEGVGGAPASVKDFHAVWVDDEGNAVMVGGRLSSLTEGQIVTFGRRLLPSVVARRARWEDEVFPLLMAGCAHSGCHLPPFTNGDLAVDTPETTRAGLVGVGSMQSPLLRVSPGRPSQSYLWHKLAGTQDSVGGSGDRMPILHLGGDAWFDDAEMEIVRAWILGGARDD